MYYHYFAISVSQIPTMFFVVFLFIVSIMQIEKLLQRHSSPRCFRGVINLKDFEIETRFHRDKNEIFREYKTKADLYTNLAAYSIQGEVELLLDLQEVHQDVRVGHEEVLGLAVQVDHREIAG